MILSARSRGPAAPAARTGKSGRIAKSRHRLIERERLAAIDEWNFPQFGAAISSVTDEAFEIAVGNFAAVDEKVVKLDGTLARPVESTKTVASSVDKDHARRHLRCFRKLHSYLRMQRDHFAAVEERHRRDRPHRVGVAGLLQGHQIVGANDVRKDERRYAHGRSRIRTLETLKVDDRSGRIAFDCERPGGTSDDVAHTIVRR